MAQEITKKYSFGTNQRAFHGPPQTMKSMMIEIEKKSSPKAFGIILVTRPIDEISPFKTYMINPDIVKTWLSPEIEIEQLVRKAKSSNSLNEEMKFIYNANEVSIRNKFSQASFDPTGVSELWWTEKKSGNEFFVSTDLWLSPDK